MNVVIGYKCRLIVTHFLICLGLCMESNVWIEWDRPDGKDVAITNFVKFKENNSTQLRIIQAVSPL